MKDIKEDIYKDNREIGCKDAGKTVNGDASNVSGENRKIKKYFWLIPGGICFVLGTLGTVLPILPTVPFYMAALFCFAKGSEKVHSWFINTNLYHKHLETFVSKKSMTMKTKVTILGGVTLLMAIGFFMMKKVPTGRIVLGIVWLAHIIYFMFCIKTEREGISPCRQEIKASRSGND